MARIREALRRAETMRKQPQSGVLAPRSSPPPAAAGSGDRTTTGDTADEEEVPFIEVGGRDTPMEASPSVLANMPKTVSRNQLEQPMQSENLGERRGTAAPAAEFRLTVRYVSFCNQGS